MRDLSDPRWIKLKGLLFVLLGLTSASVILLELPSVRLALLLAVAIWAFCRAYYFAFHAIEKYVDPSFRFSGLRSAVRYMISGHRKNPAA